MLYQNSVIIKTILGFLCLALKRLPDNYRYRPGYENFPLIVIYKHKFLATGTYG